MMTSKAVFVRISEKYMHMLTERARIERRTPNSLARLFIEDALDDERPVTRQEREQS